ELRKSLEKFRYFFKDRKPKTGLQQLTLQYIQDTQDYKSRFLVQKGKMLEVVGIQDVAYFYADNKVVWLVERGGKRYLINYTLEELTPLLDPHLFCRCSRKAIVRLEAIASVRQLEKSRLEVKLNPPAPFQLTVSAERASAFKEWLDGGI
ncbi:MAG: LytTR family DNA-binding domain-containing protein, partial [Saprospiraceae bacterium]|nr:LytTR family DNA-binding domain-containing protein [Saprospiraceae bacterium]